MYTNVCSFNSVPQEIVGVFHNSPMFLISEFLVYNKQEYDRDRHITLSSGLSTGKFLVLFGLFEVNLNCETLNC